MKSQILQDLHESLFLYPSVAPDELLVSFSFFFPKEIRDHASPCSLLGDGGSLDPHPPIQPKGSLPINASHLHSDHSVEEIEVRYFIQTILSSDLTFDCHLPTCCLQRILGAGTFVTCFPENDKNHYTELVFASLFHLYALSINVSVCFVLDVSYI